MVKKDTKDKTAKINIPHLAMLARLSLDEEATRHAEQDLHNIIAMIDQMQSVDTEGVEPMAHPMDSQQRLRSDTVTETVDRDHFQQSAPATAEGYYLVPRVVE
jgi:aspartyl-tRNA(Asn)/glutamyl-tRNA(Gln) amidotransferase subunit C